jgi:hypothetical protein
MRIHIDDSELERLEVDISAAPGRLQRNASEATVKGARRIRAEMSIDAAGHRYLPRFAKSPDYELLTPLEAEIGHKPRNKKQGSLAHILFYGSVNNAPIGDYMAGPRRALPHVERIYADAAEESVLGGGS